MDLGEKLDFQPTVMLVTGEGLVKYVVMEKVRAREFVKLVLRIMSSVMVTCISYFD